MHYANILVSVDLGDGAPDRIRLAAHLARRFEAALTGAAAHPPPVPMLVHDISDNELEEEHDRQEVREILERAEERFLRYTDNGIRADWCSKFAEPIAHLIGQARAADLIVVGHPGINDEDPHGLGVSPGPVLMEASRPVLVVPPLVEDLTGARIVVAWKDSPEARRAVSGALGFIQRSDEVFVVSVGEDARFQGADDVAAHLARHGASVRAHHLKAAFGEADEILRFAAKQDADLVVMGAYGRSRLREWVFGGVTRDILQRSPVCSLMSH